MIPILLVDDDPDEEELFNEAVEQVSGSIALQAVQDGNQLRNYLDSGNTLPGIIFLDLNLPVISGWECLKFLKESPAYAQIPVVIYSTSSDNKDRLRAIEQGANSYLTKPDSFDELVAAIAKILKAADYQVAG